MVLIRFRQWLPVVQVELVRPTWKVGNRRKQGYALALIGMWILLANDSLIQLPDGVI